MSKPIVLFSSCDKNYIKHIPTLLVSAAENISGHPIEFYLLYYDIPDETNDTIARVAQELNISYKAIKISDEDYAKFQELSKLCAQQSNYPAEGYFDILPNLHLPEHVDRALYLDAGDVIISGDITEFYFSDFHGNLATVALGFSDEWNYTADDIFDRHAYVRLAAEYFNAGVVLFNVALMRKLNLSFDYYKNIAKRVRDIQEDYNVWLFPGRRDVVYDDQGLLAMAFAGWTNFYDKETGHINTSYNFRPYLFEAKKDEFPNIVNMGLAEFKPRIIHLLGNKPNTPNNVRKTLLKISRECLALWHKYEERAAKIKFSTM